MSTKEKQQKFLDALFEEAKGDVRKAMNIAGYSSTYSSKELLSVVKDDLFELIKSTLATKGAINAVQGLIDIFEDDTMIGKKEKLAAAKEVLDRIGITKIEKVEVTTKDPLFILPSKNVTKSED